MGRGERAGRRRDVKGEREERDAKGKQQVIFHSKQPDKSRFLILSF